MMPPLEIIVHYAPEEPVTGQWCGVCLLPSLVRLAVVMVGECGGQLQWVRRAQWEFCPEHDTAPRRVPC